MRNVFRRVIRMLGCFARDEGGQSLVFAAMTLFCLVVMGMMIYGVGENTTSQMRLQNAADAASYSGAQVEADCVAQIAWINEGMAHIYAYNMRLCVDNAVLGVAAELADWKPDANGWDPNGVVGLPSAKPSDAVVGVADAPTRFTEAYQRAAEWVPRGEAWLKRLSTVQRSIAAVAPSLVEHQIFFIAKKNGSESTCFFPGFTFLPEGPTKHDVEIRKIGDINPSPWQPNGWECLSTTDSFQMSATHMHEAQEKTDVSSDSDSSKVSGFFGWSDSPGWHEIWTIALTEGSNTTEMDVKARYESDTWGERRPAVYFFKVNGPDGLEERLVKVAADGSCMVIPISGGGDQVGISFTETPESGSWMDITQNGTTISMKYDDEGYLCQWVDGDGDGEKDSDEWQRISDSTGVDVGGVEVPFDFNPHIQIGDGVSVDVTDPIHLYLKKLHVVLTNPLKINYNTTVGEINFQDARATINGLSTATADGIWKPVYHSRRSQSQDRIRHRMSVTVTDSEWLYEWVRIGAYMAEMKGKNPECGTSTGTLAWADEDMFVRFAVHAIMHTDPTFIASGATAETPDATDDSQWAANGSSGVTIWMNFPEWARPMRIPGSGVYDPAFDYGGWFDISKGKPYTNSVAKPKFGTTYSQTRECWYCADKGSIAGPLRNMMLDTADPNFGKKFVRPCGFWHDLGFPNSPEGMASRLAKYPVNAVAVGFGPKDPRNPYGRYAIQVYCPVCDENRNFADIAQHAPPYHYCDPALDITQQPTLVRRYLYHAFGRGFNMSGRNVDPTKRVMDEGYNQTTAPTKRDYYSTMVDFSSSSNYWQAPLQLTSEIFRNSITVATSAESIDGGVIDQFGGKDPTDEERRFGIYNPLVNPKWGHYAVSTSRLFVAVSPTALVDNFEWNGAPVAGESALDIIDRQKNWKRQRWLRSDNNLFEPAWTAAIVPMRKAVDPRDYYTTSELAANQDNGTSLIMRMLRWGRWRKDVTEGFGNSNVDMKSVLGWYRMSAPPMQDRARQDALSTAQKARNEAIVKLREEGKHDEALNRQEDMLDDSTARHKVIRNQTDNDKVDMESPELENVVKH